MASRSPFVLLTCPHHSLSTFLVLDTKKIFLFHQVHSLPQPWIGQSSKKLDFFLWRMVLKNEVRVLDTHRYWSISSPRCCQQTARLYVYVFVCIFKSICISYLPWYILKNQMFTLILSVPVQQPWTCLVFSLLWWGEICFPLPLTWLLL